MHFPALTILSILPLCLEFTPSAAAQVAPHEIIRTPERIAFDEYLSKAEARLIPQLEELAVWCQNARLYRERDRIYRGVLAMDPKNSTARRALRYFKQSGAWHQSTAYHVPRNRGPENLSEYRERLTLATARFRSRVFRRLERGRSSLGLEAREQVFRKLLLIDPDDQALRTVLGEARLGEHWVLEETARADRGRRNIGDLARISLEVTERPAITTPNRSERKLDLLWSAARSTPRVRVVGTTKAREVEQTAHVTDAVGVYFRGVFRRDQPHRKAYTIYLLRNPEERDRMLAGMPWIDTQTKNLLRSASGGWLGRPNVLGEWDPDPARRLDGAARQTLGTLLMDAYGVGGKNGWAWEGIGLYLVYQLTGTRKTYFIDRQAYVRTSQTTLWPKLQSPETDWLVEGRNLLASPAAPGLEFLLGRSVDTMRDEDLLVAYVLSAYLLEGRPDDVPQILRRIGAGEHPVRVFEDVLGFSVPVLERRLRRWLDEVLETR